MTSTSGGRRRLLVVAALCVLTLGAGAIALVAAGATEVADGPEGRGDDPVTVTLTVDHSRFTPRKVHVRPHTEVRFVIVNLDPIGHELIVGGPEVHARHQNGQEARHAPVPGEVSVDALARATTTYTFHDPGRVEFACHLPGHYAYGMRGIVIVDDE